MCGEPNSAEVVRLGPFWLIKTVFDGLVSLGLTASSERILHSKPRVLAEQLNWREQIAS